MSAPNPPKDIDSLVDAVAEVKGDEVAIRTEISGKVLGFLAQTGFLAGAGSLASFPRLDQKIGGAALFASGLIIADIQATGGTGPAAKAAKQIFGDMPTALQVLGVTACVALGGGAFYQMVRDGGVNNPTDPRWLMVAANFGPYLAGSLMDNPRMKTWVENHFGKTLEFAYREGNKTHQMQVETAPFYQQIALAVGAAHILAFGLLEKDAKTTFIGASFLAVPTIAAGNMISPKLTHKEPVLECPLSRRGFLRAASKLAIRPLFSGDSIFFDNIIALIGQARQPSEMGR